MQFETFAPLAAIPFIAHSFSWRDPVDATKAEDCEPHLIRTLGFFGFRAGRATAWWPRGSCRNGHRRSRNCWRRCAHHPSAQTCFVDPLRGLRAGLHCRSSHPGHRVDSFRGKRELLPTSPATPWLLMRQQFDTQPNDCLAFIGPSIVPCHYEMDLWSEIENQLRAAGIATVKNPRICTACHLSRYNSYRAEHGQTGRMFAVLSLL